MNRSCCIFVVLLFFLQLGVVADAFEEKPNIVFILADDMGYGDLVAFNPRSQISTPNLDALAHSGICFIDAHSGGSTCISSRYSLLTGRFAARKKTLNPQVPVIGEQRATLPAMLRNHGYRTAMVGKWHLGFDRKGKYVENEKEKHRFDYQQPITGGPIDRGFDSFFGMHASLDIPPYFFIRGRKATQPAVGRIDASDSAGGDENWNQIQGEFWRAGQIASDFQHHNVTQRFATEACQLIRAHDRSKPLFLYVALPSPHTPWLPSPEFVGKSKAGMYGDFVMTVDHVVGQIQSAIETAGMGEDTLLIFSSDNGPVWYQKDVDRFGHRATGDLRGIKASVWEGGHRVPFIASWPNRIESGTRSNRTIAFADLFATLAELAGQRRLPLGVAEDSVSFLSSMVQPENRPEPRPPILQGRNTIRDGAWKLIQANGNRGFDADREVKYGIELYNLDEDISEQNNLASEYPEKVAELKRKLENLLRGASRSTLVKHPEQGEWEVLFNGRDLEGWQANALADSFSVEDGVLKVHGKKGLSHLFFVGKQETDVHFKNFELIAEARSEPGSNSGIFFHTGRQLRMGVLLDKGYEVQLNSALAEKRKTGSLYDIVDLPESPVDESQWFEVRVRVEGKRIQVFLKGKQVIDYTEPPSPKRKSTRKHRLLDPNGGAIAIQAHDPKSVFYFRSIRIRELWPQD